MPDLEYQELMGPVARALAHELLHAADVAQQAETNTPQG